MRESRFRCATSSGTGRGSAIALPAAVSWVLFLSPHGVASLRTNTCCSWSIVWIASGTVRGFHPSFTS